MSSITLRRKPKALMVKRWSDHAGEMAEIEAERKTAVKFQRIIDRLNEDERVLLLNMLEDDYNQRMAGSRATALMNGTVDVSDVAARKRLAKGMKTLRTFMAQ